METSLEKFTLDEIEKYVTEKRRVERMRKKNKAKLAERLAREEQTKIAKEIARAKREAEWPIRKAENNIQHIQTQKKATKERLEKVEKTIDTIEKQLDEDLTPIEDGENIVLKDVVDEILTTYTPAVKRAIYKHRKKNIQKYNDYSREYNKKKMKDPAYAEHKKMMNARSNERARLKKLEEREALQKKLLLVKCDTIPVSAENIIIEANNGL